MHKSCYGALSVGLMFLGMTSAAHAAVAVPEPGAFGLVALGIAGVFVAARARRK